MRKLTVFTCAPRKLVYPGLSFVSSLTLASPIDWTIRGSSIGTWTFTYSGYSWKRNITIRGHSMTTLKLLGDGGDGGLAPASGGAASSSAFSDSPKDR